MRVGSLEIANEHRNNKLGQEGSNTLVIHGDNHGAIQQGGSGNTQTLSRSKAK